MTEIIPYARQDISEEDIQAVVDVLRSDYLTQGPMGPAFEHSVMQYCGVDFAVAVNSGTSALHLACLALDVGENDIVWTVPTTFVASANCVLYCGATIDFVDIDPATKNLSVDRLAEKLARAKSSNCLPRVVIAVHFCGQSCDMAAIHALSLRYGFKIIEDASHAIGARYQDEPVGCCRYSDIAVFSFHPVKIITCGEGGMAVTNDAKLAGTMKRLRSHGITSDPQQMLAREADEIWNYQQIDLGYNYRMTDLNAVLGLSQMQRLDEFVTHRNRLARRYDLLLRDLPVITPFQQADSYSSYHLYVVCLNLDEIGKTQREVYDAFREAGIMVNLHYIPVYRQPYYEKLGFCAGYCPEAERYHSETISLPMFPGLTEKQQDRVVSEMRAILAHETDGQSSAFRSRKQASWK